MFQNNELLIELKKKLHIKVSRMEGIIKKNNMKFSFLEVESKKKYLISREEVKRVMNGDRIIAQIYSQKNKVVIKLEKLIEPILDIFIGKIKKKNNIFFILPKYPFLKESILCNVSNILYNQIQDGDWVIAKLVKHKLKGSKNFSAELIKCILENDNFLEPWKIILSRHHLNYESPEMNFDEIFFDNKLFRKDLTDLEFITIDHGNTKDIDDALFIKKKENHEFCLIVAIADPTSYIPAGSYFDIIASDRLFTSYIPGLNIPMLPRKISEDLCSLHPNYKRPVLACKVIIDIYGNISSKTHFFLAWIKSQAKLTYENVSNWIENKGNWIPKTKKVMNQINLLHELCLKRITWRKENALIFKDKLEYKFYFSENKNVLNILTEDRRIAHKMIEETMIIANISAASFLSSKLGFGMYNTHAGFNKNAKRVSLVLSNHGIKVNYKEIMNLVGFCKLRRILDLYPNCYIDSRIRKYQSFGEMSLIPKPHFALGFQEYITWTSPIRKYSDMLNHRFLKNIIMSNPSKKPHNDILFKIMNRKHRNHIAQKDIEDWLYIKFLMQPKNKKRYFKAQISNISNSGMRVRLLKNGANVFIPTSYLHNIPEELICNKEIGIIYIKGKELYRVSDPILVSLIDVRLKNRNIFAKPVLI